MTQQLYFFTSDGRRTPPGKFFPVSYIFDNCALSLLTTESELSASPSAQLFKKHLRETHPGGLVIHTGPATLERYYLETHMALPDLWAEKRKIGTTLLGKPAPSESLAAFFESVAFSVARLFGLFFVVHEANSIFNSLKSDEFAEKRIARLMEWASSNRGVGAQTFVIAGVYAALGLNVSARKAFGISSEKADWKGLLNGAWDLKHWDNALSFRPSDDFDEAGLIRPVTCFVTADARLSSAFENFYHPHGTRNLVAALPIGLPTSEALQQKVRMSLGDVWPRLRSPAAYGEIFFDYSEKFKEIAVKDEGDSYASALQVRCEELAREMSKRKKFSFS